jgi:hypothetical protein
MIKNYINVFLIALALAGFNKMSFAHDADTTVITQFRTHPNSSFTYGERLSFEVSYGFITAAEAFLTVAPSPFMYNGRETYEVSLDVNSRPSFDVVYKVRDSYKTFIDAQGVFPWRFEQHLRESDYKHDFEATFIQESSKVYTKVDYKEDKNYRTNLQYVQDLISAFYYARTLDWKGKNTGDVVKVDYFYNDNFFPLQIKFQGREEVSVGAGTFRTFILEPMLQEGFTSKTSDIFVYLTDDDRKIPVKVKMKIVIGALVAELTQYQGINGNIDAKTGD